MAGLLLLAGAVLVECVIAALRATSSDELRGLRMAIRLAALASFAALAITGVITWGPRFYAFAGGLVVLTLLSVARALFRPGPAAAPVRRYGSAWRAAVTSVILAIAAFPAILFGEYAPLPTTGRHEVSTSIRTYIDGQRPDPYSSTGEPRRLTVQVWFPAEDEFTAPSRHPLVVFSHGATGLRGSNESLLRELASHGYVTASLDHTHHSLYATDEDGRRTWVNLGFLNDVGTEDPNTDKERSYQLYQEWLALRTADISFVIDRLLAEAATTDAAPGRRLVDATRIAVVGHSLGGSAAAAMGRLRADVSAVIALEAPMLGEITGVQGGEFTWLASPYPVPLLNVYSDSSWSHLGEWSQYAANHALLREEKGAEQLNYHLAGVGHFGLTDLALSSPLLTRLMDGRRSEPSAAAVLETLNRVSLTFLDEYLR